MSIRTVIRGLMRKRGYDIFKTEDHGLRLPPREIVDGLEFYRTPIGNYFVPPDSGRDSIAASMRRGKIFEEEVVNLALAYIRPGTAVLDVGANYGQMSMLFSRAVGESGQVYSFEAQELVFGILKKNVAANDCRNVVPVFGAVYDKPGVDLLFPKPDFLAYGAYGSYGINPHARTGDKVRSVTIDGMTFTKPISFMKVDIQGSDLFALRGAAATIREHRMPIVFEYEEQFQEQFGTSFQDYVDFVREIGYKFKSVAMGINYLIVPK